MSAIVLGLMKISCQHGILAVDLPARVDGVGGTGQIDNSPSDSARPPLDAVIIQRIVICSWFEALFVYHFFLDRIALLWSRQCRVFIYFFLNTKIVIIQYIHVRNYFITSNIMEKSRCAHIYDCDCE